MGLAMPGAKGRNIGLESIKPRKVRGLRKTKAQRVEAANALTPRARVESRLKSAYPWRWQPGQSANPTGVASFFREAIRIAREASPEMMVGLVNLARNAEDERVKSVCLVAVLDRAGIRPQDYDPNQEGQEPTWDPGLLSPEQREQLKEICRTMLAAQGKSRNG
jgi:hypothetical protein